MPHPLPEPPALPVILCDRLEELVASVYAAFPNPDAVEEETTIARRTLIMLDEIIATRTHKVEIEQHILANERENRGA